LFRAVQVRYSFAEASSGVSVELTLVNKTATRLPEATFFTFRPLVAGRNENDTEKGDEESTWQQSIVGEWGSPLDVADGASRGLHYTTEEGVRLVSEGKTELQIMSTDTGLLRWDAPLPFPTPLHRDVVLSEGASFCLHNNIWNTNYPFWFPFDAVGKSLRFRFRILPSAT
jgi:hypothetical protein